MLLKVLKSIETKTKKVLISQFCYSLGLNFRHFYLEPKNKKMDLEWIYSQLGSTFSATALSFMTK